MAITPRLLGPDGQPIVKEALTDEVVTTSLTSIRQPWLVAHVAGSINPLRLARLMQAAAEGQAHDYLTLAEEMEEREPHYASVLATRKRAVSGLAPTIEAASDDRQDVKLAEACRALIAAPAFGDLQDDALDALGKGYAAIEIDWETSAKQWQPTAYHWRDPRYFIYPPDNPYELRLYDESDVVNGKPLPPYKFIIHRPRLKSGIPLRGGLARLVATTYMCKAYTVKDWLAFCEVFGMPLRLGRYSQGAKEEHIQLLKAAVANLGSDAAAVLPDTLRIEFEQVGNVSGAAELFRTLAEWLDRQTSKAVLGQTMTTDDGSSQSQANIHNEVRLDILKSDARQLEVTLNRDLMKPFVDLNFGPQASYPRLVLHVEEAEDLKLLADSLEKLVPLGLKVSASVIRDKSGLPDPKDGEALLSAPAGGTTAANPIQPLALNRQAPDVPDTLDDLTDALTDDDWQSQMKPISEVQQVLQKMIADGSRLDEVKAALIDLSTEDDTALVDGLTEAAFIARALGDVSGDTR